MLLAFSQSVMAGKDECKDILKDGTRAISLYQSRYEYRRLLETKLVTMTYQESKKDTSITGNIPIGDIVLGVGYDESSFNSFKNYMKNESLLKVSISNAVDIMLSTGDPVIAAAWSECMSSQTGLAVYFSDIYPTTAILHLEWKAAAGVVSVNVNKNYKLPNGVRITSGQDSMTGKLPLKASAPAVVQFTFDNATTPLSMAINVLDRKGAAGSDTAYLPSRLEPYTQTRPYQFETGKCDKSSFMAVDARHRTGTSTTGKYCADNANGWRFTRPSVIVLPYVGIPGQIPNTFANHQIIWSGNDQFSVLLGCSNSSGTDIQCHATVAAQEERTMWRVQSDKDSTPSVQVRGDAMPLK